MEVRQRGEGEENRERGMRKKNEKGRKREKSRKRGERWGKDEGKLARKRRYREEKKKRAEERRAFNDVHSRVVNIRLCSFVWQEYRRARAREFQALAGLLQRTNVCTYVQEKHGRATIYGVCVCACVCTVGCTRERGPSGEVPESVLGVGS